MEDGIKTFPFPTKLDDRIKMIELEFGIQGYAVVWKLHQAIYSVGYYLKWDIDTQLLFINDYRLSVVGRNLVSEIVASCLRRGVFESSLYEKYGILTSERIQETFLTAKARNKKVIVNEDYALPIVYTFIKNASKNGKNVNIFFKNADISEQKKGKEKKGNNIPPNNAGESEEDKSEFELKLNAFCKKWGIAIDSCSSLIADFDFDKLDKAYADSKTFLQDKEGHPFAQSLNWIVKNYQAVIGNKKYKDRSNNKESKKAQSNKQTSDMLKSIFNHYKAEEEDDGTA